MSSLRKKKRQEGQADFTNCLYFLQDSKIKEVNVLSQQVQELEELREQYHAKLMQVEARDLLLIGGQTTQDNKRDTRVCAETTSLLWHNQKWERKSLAHMN